MYRKDAMRYVSFYVDDALAVRTAAEMPEDARLVGWQCGFEPLFVAVWSYLGVKLDDDSAIEIATDYLVERKWFANGPKEPDFIL